MPFGLQNAVKTFRRFMDQVLRGLDFCSAYIDDLLIASSSPDEHKHHLLVLKLLRHYGIINYPQKCVFGVPSVEFLGHSVDSSGIHPLLAKVQTILDFPQPTSCHRLRTFLGLTNCYHRFIPRCAKLTDPLNTLLAKSKEQLSSEA